MGLRNVKSNNNTDILLTEKNKKHIKTRLEDSPNISTIQI